MKGKLHRTSTGDEGTFGVLVLPKWHCHTVELPWRGNAHSISCIPAGPYVLHLGRMSRSVGGRRDLYRFDKVVDRAGVFIHAGNWAGDARKDYRSDSLGCPMLGLRVGVLRGQRALVGSVPAVARFLEELAGEELELEIVEEQ